MSTDQTHKNEGSNSVIDNRILTCTEKFSVLKGEKSYGELIIEQMSANPTFVGQIDAIAEREVTFSEMLKKTVKCAMWLKQQNIQPGDIIGICTKIDIDMYVPCFASLCVGAVFNAWWDAGLTKDMAKYFINLTKPKILFANGVSAKIVREVLEEMDMEIKIVVFGSLSGFQSLEEIFSSQDDTLVSEFRCTKLSSPEQPAMMMYTSGTTGLPKCAVFSHQSFHANVDQFGRHRVTKNYPISANFAPLSWLSGVYILFQDVMLQRTRIVHSEVTEEICLQLVEKYKVSWTFMGPSLAFRIQKSPAITKYDLSSLEFIFMGGAAMKEEMQKSLAETFPHAIICQGYGCTELGNAIVQQTVNSKSDSCGTITVGKSIKIIDPETGKILGPNEDGEGCFKSPHMMTCYYDNPEETSKAIDSEGWLHSGDLLHYDEDGNVFFVDRIKDLIKYKGFQISPAMIEQLLQGHPEVKEAAVFGVPNIMDDEQPIAFVSRVFNAQVTEEDLKQLVADTLPDHMKLRGGLYFLDALPHTVSGKVARSDLKKLAKSFAL